MENLSPLKYRVAFRIEICEKKSKILFYLNIWRFLVESHRTYPKEGIFMMIAEKPEKFQ